MYRDMEEEAGNIRSNYTHGKRGTRYGMKPEYMLWDVNLVVENNDVERKHAACKMNRYYACQERAAFGF